MALALTTAAACGPRPAAHPTDTALGTGGAGSGRNGKGRGGDAERDDASTNPVVQIDVGDFHSCAVRKKGDVFCWGRNRAGQVAPGTEADRPHPVRVPGVEGATRVALSSTYSCALLAAGEVMCWGSGKLLADGQHRALVPPTRVPGIRGAKDLVAGGYLTCAALESGAVRCWGMDMEAAERGGGVQGVVELAVSGSHACARLSRGRIRCFGSPPWNPGGPVSFSDPGIEGALAVATGDAFACVLVPGGRVSCWGRNDQGELGRPPDEDYQLTPREVAGIEGARAIAAGEAHLCAIFDGGTARCWGANTKGELGSGKPPSASELPQDVRGLVGAAEISIASEHACARLTNGQVQCWGANGSGQLGDGTETDRLTPVATKL
jgi:alpha-tubulin suppressor-like RCC1 family protein